MSHEKNFESAIQSGNLSAVTDYINASPQLINITFTDGSTPIFMAATCGHTDIVKLLIEKGVNFNAPMRSGKFQGYTPLFMSVLHDKTPTTLALLSAYKKNIVTIDLSGIAKPSPYIYI